MTTITMNQTQSIIYHQLTTLLSEKLLHALTTAGDQIGQEVRLVGGAVRDLLLKGELKQDLDFVTLGSGIRLAEEVSRLLGKGGKLSVFKSFGTAQVHWHGLDLEFVGARKESYRQDSRKPIVEEASLEEDEARRDFTINALSLTLNGPHKGRLNDPFGGIADIQNGIIRTPLDPDKTFADDPLRMMRAVRFASQLNFRVSDEAFASIKCNANRLRPPVVSIERITTEFIKIIDSPRPSIGLALMERTGLMPQYLPEVSALKGAETKEGIGHKDNFTHTIIVVDNVAKVSDNTFLRLAALFHDIGKPVTKRFESGFGWSFHNHDYVGQKMLPRIFRRLKLPLGERLDYVGKLVRLHMRPAQLADEGVTDSAIRRLLFEAGDDIDDLMTLCESDLTSKNPAKVAKYLANFKLVRQKLIEIEEKDRIRNFQPPVTGNDIMHIYNLTPRRELGQIKEQIKDAILDGVIPNDRAAALEYMYQIVEQQFPEFKVVNPISDQPTN